MSDRDRIEELLRRAWELRITEEWDETLAVSEEARALSERVGFMPGVSRAYSTQAFVHYIRSDFRRALSLSIDALHMTGGDAEAECRARSVLAMVHWSLGNYEEALKNGDRSLELMDRINDAVTKAFALAVKGGILLSLGDPEEALLWHQRSIEAFRSIPDQMVGRARALSGLGLTYLAQKRFEQALATLLEALELARSVNHRITIARALNDLGEAFEGLENDEQALIYHAEALEIRQEDGYRQAETTSLLALGRIYARRGEHDRAAEYLDRGLRIAEELEIRPRIAQFHQKLAELSKDSGQLAAALNHYMAAQQIRSELDVDQAALRYKAIMFEAQLEAMHRSLELESLASLGGLVAAIAHELNSPLGAVQSSAGAAMLAAGKLMQGHDLKAVGVLQENTKVIVDASRRMSELVTRLKVIAGVDQARYTRVDLVQAVNDVMALLRPEYDQRVELTLEHEDVPPVYVHGPDLYQVFLNLLRNSLQAIEGAGAIRVRIAMDHEWFRIVFSDNGRGIPREQIRQLFTPGFSSNSGRVRASLSLFTCMLIVKKHGGDIRVESELGSGSTFTILLPRSIEKIDPKQEAAGTVL